MAQKIPETITEKELIQIIKMTKLKHHKLAWLLGFYQCMRVSEVVKLRKKDVDLDRGLISIKQSKGNKDRNIPIAPEIRRYLHWLPVSIGKRALQIAFKVIARNTLGKDLRFHTLRHSGATHYLNIKKWNIRLVQQFLGHSRLDTTQIYTHVTVDDLRNAMNLT